MLLLTLQWSRLTPTISDALYTNLLDAYLHYFLPFTGSIPEPFTTSQSQGSPHHYLGSTPHGSTHILHGMGHKMYNKLFHILNCLPYCTLAWVCNNHQTLSSLSLSVFLSQVPSPVLVVLGMVMTTESLVEEALGWAAMELCQRMRRPHTQKYSYRSEVISVYTSSSTHVHVCFVHGNYCELGVIYLPVHVHPYICTVFLPALQLLSHWLVGSNWMKQPHPQIHIHVAPTPWVCTITLVGVAQHSIVWWDLYYDCRSLDCRVKLNPSI